MNNKATGPWQRALFDLWVLSRWRAHRPCSERPHASAPSSLEFLSLSVLRLKFFLAISAKAANSTRTAKSECFCQFFLKCVAFFRFSKILESFRPVLASVIFKGRFQGFKKVRDYVSTYMHTTGCIMYVCAKSGLFCSFEADFWKHLAQNWVREKWRPAAGRESEVRKIYRKYLKYFVFFSVGKLSREDVWMYRFFCSGLSEQL